MPPPPPHPPVHSNPPTQQTHAQPTAPHPTGPPPGVHAFENPFIHSYPLRPPPGKKKCMTHSESLCVTHK